MKKETLSDIQKNNLYIIIALFLITFSIGMISSQSSGIKWWDETVYANLGHDLSNNPFNYSYQKWGDWVSTGPYLPGFRAPLLPYLLAGISFLGNSFIPIFLSIIAAFGVVTLFVLTKKLFDEKTALYASIFMMVTPLYIFYSSKILSDILALFLALLSAYLFLSGFENNSKKSKLVCGFVTALAVLARYTNVILILLYFMYLLATRKNIAFLKDKYLILSALVFLLVLSPWFYYGYVAYGNPVGPFLHAQQASTIWGGAQPWYFVIQNAFTMFSMFALFGLAGIYYAVRKSGKNNIFVLLWFFAFIIFASAVLHKEDRYFLPLIPAIAIMSAIALKEIFKKLKLSTKFKKALIAIIIVISVCGAFTLSYSEYTNSHTASISCFLSANAFLSNTENNSVVITDSSAIVYYYTHRENHFYTTDYTQLKSLIDTYYSGRPVYILWSEYDIHSNRFQDELNVDAYFELVYKCPENGSLATVYAKRI